jgi:predicted nucleotidyltransferase
MDLAEIFGRILGALDTAARRVYGDRLVALVVFGSVGRGTQSPDSDIDVLLVADDLPRGRTARVEEFRAVQEALRDVLGEASRAGVNSRVSAVFKTPSEVQRGSPLFLDMTEDARILYDRAGFFATYLDALRRRLAKLGARRVWQGDAWYWDLKPDFKPGDVIEL